MARQLPAIQERRHLMKRHRVIGTSEAAIRAAEIQLNRELPKSFSDWLLTHNGLGDREALIFPIYDARDPRKTWDSIVRHFTWDWQQWQENFSDEPHDFSGLLPFAEFGTGDYYCFDYNTIGGAGEPVVVLWRHETGQTRKIADNFAAFLRMPSSTRLGEPWP